MMRRILKLIFQILETTLMVLGGYEAYNQNWNRVSAIYSSACIVMLVANRNAQEG